MRPHIQYRILFEMLKYFYFNPRLLLDESIHLHVFVVFELVNPRICGRIYTIVYRLLIVKLRFDNLLDGFKKLG